jgi:hypothetical protein
MPTNKHKRKASAHSKSTTVKKIQPGVITSHPKVFIVVGLLFVTLSIYLFTFEYQDDAMFGLAMLSLIVGVITTLYAKIVVTKKNKD